MQAAGRIEPVWVGELSLILRKLENQPNVHGGFFGRAIFRGGLISPTFCRINGGVHEERWAADQKDLPDSSVGLHRQSKLHNTGDMLTDGLGWINGIDPINQLRISAGGSAGFGFRNHMTRRRRRPSDGGRSWWRLARRLSAVG